MADSDLGIRIRRARERKRWSQEQLAAAVGAGVRSVGRWERGDAVPRNSIGALEEVLGISLDGDDDQAEVYTDPDEAKIWSWADLPEWKRREMIGDLREARAAARKAS